MFLRETPVLVYHVCLLTLDTKSASPQHWHRLVPSCGYRPLTVTRATIYTLRPTTSFQTPQLNSLRRFCLKWFDIRAIACQWLRIRLKKARGRPSGFSFMAWYVAARHRYVKITRAYRICQSHTATHARFICLSTSASFIEPNHVPVTF